MLVSGGRLVTKTPLFPNYPTGTSDWFYNYERLTRWSGYAQMYCGNLWVYILVRKRAGATARLPLKVYERDDLNRPEAQDHPFAQLMRNPNPAISTFRFWEWTSSTYDIYGEAFWYKRRDNRGTPYQLVPLHPTGMTLNPDGSWDFQNDRGTLKNIPARDVVHFRTYNPGGNGRGLSPLEPLRPTLENEFSAQTATSSMWARGARPGMVLKHPRKLSDPGMQRLKAQWDALNAGAHNHGKTVILEEGMEALPITLTAEEAQYIETRKLNREEVCGAYDVPPPVVHILDRATFSNITEQMRSMYRDTMAPHLKGFEADIATQLQIPDFGDDVYAEFLLDEVLRGDFEARAAAYKAADYMTIAEKRRAENLPYIEGTDQILINGAEIPLAALLADASTATPANTGDELVIDAEADQPAIEASATRSLMGRLSWQKSLDEVDPVVLTAGLNGSTEAVLLALHRAKTAGDDVPGFKNRLRSMVKETQA